MSKKEWKSRCGVCNIDWKVQSENNPYPNGLFCPECRNRGYVAPGVLHWVECMQVVGMTERGYTIFREPNEVGGHRYWSDEIGGGVMIWDTSLASIESLKFAIDYELSQGENKDEKSEA